MLCAFLWIKVKSDGILTIPLRLYSTFITVTIPSNTTFYVLYSGKLLGSVLVDHYQSKYERFIRCKNKVEIPYILRVGSHIVSHRLRKFVYNII
jgi:hypothetical protein